MRAFVYIFFLFLPGMTWCQSSDTVDDAENLAYEKKKAELAIDLQNGLAKLRVGENNEDLEIKLNACLELAGLYEREQYYDKELTFLEQAGFIANELGKDEDRLLIQSKIAESHFRNQEWEAAYDYSEELFEQHQIFGQYKPAIKDLERMAESAIQLNNFVIAREQYLKIMEIAQIVQDRPVQLNAMNNMGFAANHLDNYEEAVHYFDQVDAISSLYKNETPGHVYTNLGIAWHNMGEKDKALKNLRDAEKKDAKRISYIQHLISSIYLTDDDVYNALTYNELAIAEAKKTKDMNVMADAYGMASDIYQQLYEYDKALDYYKLHLTIKDSLERINLINQKELENVHAYLDDTENSIRQSLIESELKQANLEQAELLTQTLQLELESEKQVLQQERQAQQIALLEKQREAKEASVRAAKLEADRTRQELELATQTNLALKREQEIEALNQQHQLDSLEAAKKSQEQAQKYEVMQQKQVIAMKDQQSKAFRTRMYTLAALGMLIMIIITGSWFYARRLNRELGEQNEKIENQNQEIQSERNRAERLLLNILPAAIAYELKEKGAATPQHYDAVSVLFTDFEGFTAIASTMPPAEVVRELNECFVKFDEIAEKYNLEKIKTIGDSYMCAGGLPVANQTHPTDSVNAGREILAFIDARNKKLTAQGKPAWPIRIGIHTGELVAGVVGSKKFAYDIWGDTVNVASRMESNSEAGQINISEATYQLVNDHFKCKFRGEIDVKNKGKMGMYIVNG